jgi:hypothetical protein
MKRVFLVIPLNTLISSGFRALNSLKTCSWTNWIVHMLMPTYNRHDTAIYLSNGREGDQLSRSKLPMYIVYLLEISKKLAIGPLGNGNIALKE